MPCVVHRSRVSFTLEEGKGSAGFRDRVARCGDEGSDGLESAARLIDSIGESFGVCARGGWAVD